jgi:hypothetical protein
VANPILYVNFFANGTISVTLGDGTTVGAPSGTPTVIPAGYYTLEFSGPGGCSVLPYFRLKGPGVSIATNGNEGQVVHPPSSVQFSPASSYSWTDDAIPGVVNQFSTSSQVVGSPAVNPPAPTSRGTISSQSQNVVGSALLPFLGSLSGTISASGKVTLRHNGKPVTNLKAGRYTFNVLSKSPRSGFVIERSGSHTVALARGAFSGRRSMSVSLSSGKWIFMATPGASSAFVVG